VILVNIERHHWFSVRKSNLLFDLYFVSDILIDHHEYSKIIFLSNAGTNENIIKISSLKINDKSVFMTCVSNSTVTQ
jgi:hypothetical protein